jgi:hypothetical protein
MPAGQLPVGGTMIYSEALVSQLFLLNYWAYKTIYRRDGVTVSPQVQPTMVDMFSKADTYYISQEIGEVLSGGLDTLPNTPLGNIRPNSPYGWAFFQKPLSYSFPAYMQRLDWNLQGLAWGPSPDSPASRAGLNIAVFGLSPLTAHLECVGMTAWEWRGGWDVDFPRWGLVSDAFENLEDDTVEYGPEEYALGQWMSKLILSFFAFIRQECVTIQNQPAARPIRRHLPKTYTAEPIIKVIQLRRRSTATNGDESVSVDYSCRWLVRGHWRNQFYPGSKSHRPRYIQPYVKGPDDKPLKPTKSSLFAVVR